MNESVTDMATLRCNNDIFEHMKYYKRALNGSKIIISICFFLNSNITLFGYYVDNFAGK